LDYVPFILKMDKSKYGHLEKKSRDVVYDLKYIIRDLEDIIFHKKEIDFHVKELDKKLEREGKFLFEMIKKYANGTYVYRHSKYFNPVIARDLQKEIHDKMRRGTTIEELVEFLELCKKIKREYSGK